jgi:hypothetical protein
MKGDHHTGSDSSSDTVSNHGGGRILLEDGNGDCLRKSAGDSGSLGSVTGTACWDFDDRHTVLRECDDHVSGDHGRVSRNGDR